MFKLIVLFLCSFLAFEAQATGVLESSTQALYSSLLGMISFFTPIFTIMGVALIVMSFFIHKGVVNIQQLMAGGCMLTSPVVFKVLTPEIDVADEINQPTSLWETITQNISFTTIISLCVIMAGLIIISIIYTMRKRHSELLLLQRKREKDLNLLSKVSDLYLINYDLIQKQHSEFKDIMETIRSEKKKFDKNEEYTLKNKNSEKFNKFLQAALTIFPSSVFSDLNLKK